jgi:tRNA(Ile)-lysidine synthase
VTGPHPAVAAVRSAVRECLADLGPQPLAVAFSGGADSTALLAATCFERPGQVTALIADQHWYEGSAGIARESARRAAGLGAAAEVLDAPSERDEAAARTARYRALRAAAERHDCGVVLLGHTRDDQAETVLLGLARGSGARSLAGMAGRRGPYRRPLLDVSRATTRAACDALELPVYDDPANLDPRFARTRLRRDALPALQEALGRDLIANLARTARLLRDDADLLDEWAAREFGRAENDDGSLDVAVLASLPPALRRRVLRHWAPGSSAVQVDALDSLVVRWHGQKTVALAAGNGARRVSGRIERVGGPAMSNEESPRIL